MRCTEARPLFSSYLDRAVSGTEMHDIFGHLEQCAECQKEYSLLENTRSLVSSLGRRQPPSDLALKIRVAISSTRSRNSLSLFQRYASAAGKYFPGLHVSGDRRRAFRSHLLWRVNRVAGAGTGQRQ